MFRKWAHSVSIDMEGIDDLFCSGFSFGEGEFVCVFVNFTPRTLTLMSGFCFQWEWAQTISIPTCHTLAAINRHSSAPSSMLMLWCSIRPLPVWVWSRFVWVAARGTNLEEKSDKTEENERKWTCGQRVWWQMWTRTRVNKKTLHNVKRGSGLESFVSFAHIIIYFRLTDYLLTFFTYFAGTERKT